MGIFDPTSFLNATIKGALSTQITPLEPAEYTAMVGDISVVEWTSKDQRKSGYKFVAEMKVIDEGVKEKLGREPVLRYDMMLDLTPEGNIDNGVGKNVALGRLQKACGLDSSGSFSPRQLTGNLVKIRVSQRIDGDNIYNDIKAVSPAE